MYRVFIFEMYSLVIKIAILVNSAVLLEDKLPALGINTANVLVEADPIKNSATINKIFFLSNFYISFYNTQYLF